MPTERASFARLTIGFCEGNQRVSTSLGDHSWNSQFSHFPVPFEDGNHRKVIHYKAETERNFADELTERER